MIDFGIVKPGRTLYVPFDSFAGSTGASITLSGLAVTDIEVYKDGSTTQRASDNGYTLLDTDGIDFDGLTGIHGFSINLADNSDAGFYASGSRYFVVVSSVTVDTQTVSFVACTFSIGHPDAVLSTTIATLSTQTSFTLTAGPAEDDALNGMWAIIHDVASAVQMAIVQIIDYAGASKTVTLAAGATFTAAATDNILIMGPMPLQPTAHAIQSPGRTLSVGTDNAAQADVAKLSGDATAADNAEAFFDGTGYAGTNNVIPLVTTVTNLTNAATNGDLTATMKASVNMEVDSALDTAIPGTPTANSINERVQTMDNAYTATRGGYLDNINNAALQTTAAQTGDSYAIVNSGTHGNAALKILIDTVDTVVDAILDDTGTSGVVLTASERNSVATALLDLAAGVETNRTLRQAMRLILAASAGKLSGAATSTVVIRDTNDGKDRITATVDSDGNRTAVTYDQS